MPGACAFKFASLFIARISQTVERFMEKKWSYYLEFSTFSPSIPYRMISREYHDVMLFVLAEFLTKSSVITLPCLYLNSSSLANRKLLWRRPHSCWVSYAHLRYRWCAHSAECSSHRKFMFCKKSTRFCFTIIPRHFCKAMRKGAS